jgi:endonuclease-8
VPEGHTIHRLALDHSDRFVGRTVTVTSPQDRFAAASWLDGQVMTDVEAYGKHLLYRFGEAGWVHIHLGLFGKIWTKPTPLEPARSTVRMRLATSDWFADLVGPTRCMLIDADERAALFQRLGPDPLRADAVADAAWQKLSKSRQSVAALLMDQHVIAGIGNAFRAELLYRAGLNPYVEGIGLTFGQWQMLWRDAKRMMRLGVRANRIVTTRPEDREHRHGRVQPSDATYVYRRAEMPCRRCGSIVLMEPLAGRRLYWCPSCQR